MAGGIVMRQCDRCGKEFGIVRHIFLRGDFCSKKCFEDNKRYEALRLQCITQRGEPQGSAASLSPRTPKDEARAAIWNGILGAAKYIGKRELLPTKRRPSVFLLQEGGSQTPVYFINAGLHEFRLAQSLRSAHSIFGVEIPWPLAWRRAAANNETSFLPTMEKMVAPYVAELRAHARSSPCVLAGYSFGGLMAFEAAHQLKEQGVKVEMVILLDAQAQYPTERAPHQVAWQQLQNEWKRAPDQRSTDQISQSIAFRLRRSCSAIWWMLLKEMRGLGRYLIRDSGPLTSRLDEFGMPLHWTLIKRMYDHTLESYSLRCLDCRGILFRGDSEDENSLGDNLGWDNLFSEGLEIIQVAGDHKGMMSEEPFNRILAREMNKLLN